MIPLDGPVLASSSNVSSAARPPLLLLITCFAVAVTALQPTAAPGTSSLPPYENALTNVRLNTGVTSGDQLARWAPGAIDYASPVANLMSTVH